MLRRLRSTTGTIDVNNKLRFGILGTARIARTVIPHIQASHGAEVVAVASRSIERAEKYGNELKIPHAFGSYEEILHDPNIDAVYIPLPASMHCEYVLKSAAAAGIGLDPSSQRARGVVLGGTNGSGQIRWERHDVTRTQTTILSRRGRVTGVGHSGRGRTRRWTANQSNAGPGRCGESF